jgi:MFS family permease
LRAVIAPLIVVALAVPAIVLVSLLLVAWTMTPAMVRLVAERRFPALQRRGHASSWWQGLAWSVGCTGVALLALILSVPLWLVPPLALVLPALIWGWLAAKVFGFDALAAHADVHERRHLLHAHRGPLLAMGIATGLLGTAPSLVWAVGALALIFAPLLAVLSVWLYLLIFAFGALWFAHFALDRLQRLRDAELPPVDVVPPPPPPALPEPARP